ncbi:hypothetical protein FQN57_002210 [Myotisia sp. PD_48]|nr:hypothetical protein FQN57_002210 [Myotisia sp. PD_48]
MSQEEWTPPKIGSPVWIEIFATDLDRAEKFYSTVFGWHFPSAKGKRTEEIALFEFQDPGLKSLGGGLTKVKPEEITTGQNSTKLYIYVENLDRAVEKIIANGGKKCTEREPEGDHGEIIRCEDSEGNALGIYASK